MKIQTIKLKVMQKIMSVDEKALLDKIEKILDEEMIVGYTIDGEPLTKRAYMNRLAKGEEQYKIGDYTNHVELGRQIGNW